MSLADIDTTGRNRNVLAPPVDTITVSPASGSNTPGTISGNFAVFSVPVNLRAPVNTNTLIYTVPIGKRFVIQDVTYTLNSVVGSTATTLPTVQLYRGTGIGSTNQLSNSFNFGTVTFPSPLVAGYWVRTGSSSSTTARAVALAGDNINCRIFTAFVSGGTTPYTTINASCIVSGYELDAV